MKRIFAVVMYAAILAMLILPLAALAAPLDSSFYFYNFERSLDDWTPATDSGKVGANALTLQTERVYSKDPAAALVVTNSYAAVTNIAGGAGSAHWMQIPVFGEGNVVQVVFKVRRVAGCWRCVGLAYAGRQAPTDVTQFQRIDIPSDGTSWVIRVFETNLDGAALGTTPAASYTKESRAVQANEPDKIPEADQVIVALGYMNMDVAEPKQRIGFDDVSLSIIDLTNGVK